MDEKIFNGTYIKNPQESFSVDRIKRLSTEIMNQYQDKFGTDFSTNKQFLNQVSIIRSKSLKNKIAGYITKIIQRKQKFESMKQELIDNDKKLDMNEPTPEPVVEPTPEPVVEPTPEPVIIEEPVEENTVAEEILNDDNSEKTS